MNLKQIHHVAIIGSDYEKSKHFYVDLLGFDVIRENYRAEREDYKIDLQLADCEIELFIMKDHPKRLSPEAYGLRHLAFRVESVEDTVQALNRLLEADRPHDGHLHDRLGRYGGRCFHCLQPAAFLYPRT